MSEWEAHSGDYGASINATPVESTPEGVEAGVDMLFQNYLDLATKAVEQSRGKSVKDKVQMMFLLLKTLMESAALNMDGLLDLVKDLAVDEEMAKFNKEWDEQNGTN